MLPDAHPPHPPPNMTTEVCLCHKSCQYDYVQSRMPDVNISCSRHLLLLSETGTDAQCGERGRRNRWGRACSLAPVCAIAALAAWTCRPVRATQASAVLRGQADWEPSNQAATCRASLRDRQTCNKAWNQVLLMRSQADSSPQARHRAHARRPQTQKNSRCRVLRLALCPLSRGPSRAVLAGPCSVRTAQHPSSPWSERRPKHAPCAGCPHSCRARARPPPRPPRQTRAPRPPPLSAPAVCGVRQAVLSAAQASAGIFFAHAIKEDRELKPKPCMRPRGAAGCHARRAAASSVWQGRAPGCARRRARRRAAARPARPPAAPLRPSRAAPRRAAPRPARPARAGAPRPRPARPPARAPARARARAPRPPAGASGSMLFVSPVLVKHEKVHK